MPCAGGHGCILMCHGNVCGGLILMCDGVMVVMVRQSSVRQREMRS